MRMWDLVNLKDLLNLKSKLGCKVILINSYNLL